MTATNPYYQASGAPSVISRGTSTTLRDEFAAIQSGFDKISTTGRNWTGTHDFSGGTLKATTATFGASGNNVATLDFVNVVAMNAALPGQTGNLGKIITTNGTTASWTDKINASVMKLADGTDSTKQAQFDASGIATGTTRTLTVPDKSGTLAMTSDISASTGSSMALLGTANISSAVASVDFLNVFSASYDSYVIEVMGITNGGGATATNVPQTYTTLNMQFAASGTAITTGYGSIARFTTNAVASGSTTYGASSSSFGWLSTGNQQEINLRICVRNTNTTSRLHMAEVIGSAVVDDGTATNTSNLVNIFASAFHVGSTALSGFKLYPSSGTWSTGRVRVYGIKNS